MRHTIRHSLARTCHLPKGLIVSLIFLGGSRVNIKVIPYPQTVAVRFQDVQSRCSGVFFTERSCKKIMFKDNNKHTLQQNVNCIHTDGQTIQTPLLFMGKQCVCGCDKDVKQHNKNKGRIELRSSDCCRQCEKLLGIRIVLPWQPSHFPVTPAKPAGKLVAVVVVVWGHPELGGNRRVLWRCYNSEVVSVQSGSLGLFSTQKEREGLSWVKLHVRNMEMLSGALNYIPKLRSARIIVLQTIKKW